MQNKIATLPSSISAPPIEKDVTTYEVASSRRRWELSVGFKTKIYLTDEERNYYIEQLKLGKKIVLVGEMVLTKQFNYLIPVRNKPLPDKDGIIYY